MLRSSAQRANTSAASTAAAGTAAAAASVAPGDRDRRGDERDEGRERERIVPARQHEQARGDQIGAERRRRHAVDLAGLARPVRTAGPTTIKRRGQREAGDDVEGMRAERIARRPSPMPGKVHSTPKATAVMASQRHSRKRASAKAAAVTTAR